MTIAYSNGTVLQATVLAHDEHEIRVIATGQEDVLTFTCVHDTWISEALEPVTVEFAWQRRPATSVPSDDDCICPKELAAQLMHALFSGDEQSEAGVDSIYGFNSQGDRVPMQRTEFRLA